MRDFYVIAKKDAEPKISNSPDWPKIIGYCYEDKCFIFIEGNGYGFNGIVLPEHIAREAKWDRLFTELHAHWILSSIENFKFSDRISFEAHLKFKNHLIEILKS
ncbi:hypothetical protein [Pseudomonas kitaguniensis]|uniref:hypothetical protein n=1 Tax=Pseudomonas kitaguniensis TaxID=2607908 RepID=UPI003D070193